MKEVMKEDHEIINKKYKKKQKKEGRESGILFFIILGEPCHGWR